jgi:hypothetical protein
MVERHRRMLSPFRDRSKAIDLFGDDTVQAFQRFSPSYISSFASEYE